jgi:hypothetical protein
VSRAHLRAALAGERRRPVVLPLLTRHAAKLEQVPLARTLTSPDVAARALVNSQKLYGLDAVLAAGPELVGLAARSAAAPGVPAPVLLQQHTRGERLTELPDPDELAAGDVIATAVAIVQRLRGLLGDRAGVGVPVPVAGALAADLGHPDEAAWAEQATGAVVRALGAEEPDVVVHLGPGASGGLVAGLCDFFGIALVEAHDDPESGVVAPAGEDFVDRDPATGWIHTTSSEVPADADPREVSRAVERIRAAAAVPGEEQE